MTDTLWTSAGFSTWLGSTKFKRAIKRVQLHHTYKPGYAEFKGNNHTALQNGMRTAHKMRGFTDIAQQLTIFPDGQVMSGRSFELDPAGIKGQNTGAVCIENIGNFDIGGETMSAEQRSAIVEVVAVLCKRFSLKVDTTHILYHHWFDLITGERGPSGSHKTCPGTAFFGGNTEEACVSGFLPLVSNGMKGLAGGAVA